MKTILKLVFGCIIAVIGIAGTIGFFLGLGYNILENIVALFLIGTFWGWLVAMWQISLDSSDYLD